MCRRPVSASATAAAVRSHDPDERECPDALGADQDLTHLRAHAREQRDRESGPSHQRVGEGEGVEATLARVFATTALPASAWTNSAWTWTLIG